MRIRALRCVDLTGEIEICCADGLLNSIDSVCTVASGAIEKRRVVVPSLTDRVASLSPAPSFHGAAFIETVPIPFKPLIVT